MSKIIRTEITQTQHGLIGVEDVVYEYDIFLKGGTIKVGNNEPKELTYEQCNRLKKMLIGDDEIEQEIDEIKQIAADCCEIPLFRIYEKTRLENIVLARYFVFWYVYTILKFTQKKTGLLFDKDHATVIHATKIVNDFMDDNENVKFLKPDQKRWATNFINKIKELDENKKK